MKIEPEGENPGGRLSLNINFRYIYGAETEYLKKEDIVYTEVPLEGGGSYYTVDYTPNYSKTDLMQIGVGLSYDF